MRPLHAASSLVLSLLALTSACAGDEAGGSPPSISDLSYGPASVTVGQQNVVTGSFGFEDPDADVLELAIEIELSDGSRQLLPPTSVEDTAGDAVGTIALTLAITPPAPGAYRFELWLVDTAGGESNRLAGDIDAG